jgi:hypothetical protein
MSIAQYAEEPRNLSLSRTTPRWSPMLSLSRERTALNAIQTKARLQTAVDSIDTAAPFTLLRPLLRRGRAARSNTPTSRRVRSPGRAGRVEMTRASLGRLDKKVPTAGLKERRPGGVWPSFHHRVPFRHRFQRPRERPKRSARTKEARLRALPTSHRSRRRS